MWVGLFFSFSQSSFAALATGVVVAALVLWGRRAALAVAVLAVLFSVGALAIPHVRDRIDTKSRSGLDSITSDRSTLVGQGVRIALDRPVGGVGAGGFKRAYADRVGLKGKRPKTAASHTTPVTVAAEEGIPGLLLFVWLVAAAVLGTLRGLGHGFTSRVSFAVGLTLVAITVHSLFYNALFEDPMTWALFGLVGLAASVPRKGPAANGGER
jgi:O-antigen ligase